MTIPQALDNKTWRSHTPATALQVSVAALVRARTTRFKPKDQMCLTGSRRIVPHMRDAPYLALRLSACAVKNWAAVKRTRDSRCRAEPTAIHCHYSTQACYFGCCGTGTERLSRTRRTAAPEFRLATPRRVCAEELCVVVGFNRIPAGKGEHRPQYGNRREF